MRNKQRAGYIYFLKVYNSNFYKIGRTIDPNDRRRTFSVKLPFFVEFQALIPVDDMYRAERIVHAYYADKRINGEFFSLTSQDIESIQCEGIESINLENLVLANSKYIRHSFRSNVCEVCHSNFSSIRPAKTCSARCRKTLSRKRMQVISS